MIKAGRELDNLVHEKVLGLCAHQEEPVPGYSSVWNDLRFMVEHQHERGYVYHVGPDIDGTWRVVTSRFFYDKDVDKRHWDDTHYAIYVKAETMPLALCVAAAYHYLDDESQDFYGYDPLAEFPKYEGEG